MRGTRLGKGVVRTAREWRGLVWQSGNERAWIAVDTNELRYGIAR